MYAVVATGGKQYRVEPGTTLLVERLTAEAGATVTFDRVLLVGEGEAVTIGTPTVSGATVSGTVLAQERGPKLVIFKFRQKVKYRRRRGHRQQLTRVRIDAINGAGSAGDEKPARRSAPRTRAKKAAAGDEQPAVVQDAADPKPSRRRAKPAAAEAAAEPAKRPRRTSAAKKAAEEQ